MRCLRASIVLLPLLAHSSDDGQELRFAVPAGARVEKTFEGHSELNLDEQSLTINDEEVGRATEDFDLRATWTRTLVFHDEFLEVGRERPLVLTREFRSLESRDRLNVEAGGESHEQTLEGESALEGLSVRFTWSEDDGEYACRYDGEERGDRSLLADLVADSDLLGLLPGREVAEGDSWKLDPLLFHHLTSPGGDVHLRSEESDVDAERQRQFRENLDGKFSATFEGVREEDGVRVAVIALRADVSTQATTHGEDEDGDPVETHFVRDSDCEGELLWDLEAGRPHSYRLTGDVRAIRSQKVSWVDEDDGEHIVMVERTVMSGEATFSGSWRALD